MKLYAACALAIALLTSSPASAAPPIPVQGVSQYLFDRIVHFAKVAMATYASDSCTIPSLPRLGTFHNTTTEIYGWVLRDDSTRELIVSFRGTNATVNHVFDRNWNLTDFTNLVPSCAGCETHAGYRDAWDSISDQVFALVGKERDAYPHYGLIVTGHSLGAGLAAIYSAQLAQSCTNLTVFTYGEPRSGNLAFADFMDRSFRTCFLESASYFRVTHADDGIVPVPYLNESYVHQGLELWSSADPASPSNTYVCPSEGFCCETAGGLGQGINAAHNAYFNVSAGTCSQNV